MEAPPERCSVSGSLTPWPSRSSAPESARSHRTHALPGKAVTTRRMVSKHRNVFPPGSGGQKFSTKVSQSCPPCEAHGRRGSEALPAAGGLWLAGDRGVPWLVASSDSPVCIPVDAWLLFCASLTHPLLSRGQRRRIQDCPTPGGPRLNEWRLQTPFSYKAPFMSSGCWDTWGPIC